MNSILAKWKIVFNALFVANMISIFSILGFFNVVDSLLLSHAVDLSHNQTEEQVEKHNRVSIVSLNPTWFESINKEASPVDRVAMKSVLNQIGKNDIAYLAIDIDLSPSVYLSDSEQQNELDNQLIALSKQLKGVILPIPFPAYTQALTDAKLAWLKKMCNAGIFFAYATQNVNFWMGRNISYVNDINSVSNSALNLAEALVKIQTGDLAKCNVAQVVQAFAKGRNYDKDQFVRNVPININQLSSIDRKDYSGDSEISLDAPIVFLGMDNGRNDYFTLGGQTYPGYFFHALNFLSIKHPVQRQPFVSFVLDFSLTLLLLAILKYISFIENRAQFRCGLVKQIVFSGANVFLLVLVGLVLLYLMPLMLSLGIWDNLFAVLLSVYLLLFIDKDDQRDKVSHNSGCSLILQRGKYGLMVCVAFLDFWLML